MRLPANHTGGVVVVFARRAPTTTTASEAPCIGLEVVALQHLKTTTSGIQMRKRLGVLVVVGYYRTQKTTTTAAEIALPAELTCYWVKSFWQGSPRT